MVIIKTFSKLYCNRKLTALETSFTILPASSGLSINAEPSLLFTILGTGIPD